MLILSISIAIDSKHQLAACLQHQMVLYVSVHRSRQKITYSRASTTFLRVYHSRRLLLQNTTDTIVGVLTHTLAYVSDAVMNKSAEVKRFALSTVLTCLELISNSARDVCIPLDDNSAALIILKRALAWQMPDYG